KAENRSLFKGGSRDGSQGQSVFDPFPRGGQLGDDSGRFAVDSAAVLGGPQTVRGGGVGGPLAPPAPRPPPIARGPRFPATHPRPHAPPTAGRARGGETNPHLRAPPRGGGVGEKEGRGRAAGGVAGLGGARGRVNGAHKSPPPPVMSPPTQLGLCRSSAVVFM